MIKKYLKVVVVMMIFLTNVLFAVGCTSTSKMEEVFKSYSTAWKNQEFEKMYEILSEESKNSIGKEEFLELYESNYSLIRANNLSVTMINEEIKENEEFNIKVSMDTIGGKIESSEVKLSIVEENDQCKIVWHEGLILPTMKKGDDIGIEAESYKGKRGNIYDRNNNLLAGDGILRPVEINLQRFNDGNEVEKVNQIAEILDISKEFIENQIQSNTNPEQAVHIVKLLEEDTEKMDKLIEITGVQIPKVTNSSRVYYGGEALGSLIGYVDDITAEQLEKNKDKGYTKNSQIGVGGIEEVYEEKLRAINGGKVYIKREDGTIDTIAEKQGTNGKDIKLSIDLELQQNIYNEMEREKGSSVAINPKSGEVLAMVSSPSFDSNTYTTYLTKTEKQRWEDSENAHIERRFKNAYSPGSTMKLVTASIGLDNKTINPDIPVNIEGKYWGEYKVTRVKDDISNVNLKDATKYSDNIYFAKMGLEIGSNKYVEGAGKFGLGQVLNFEYPISKSQISNNGKLDDKSLLAHTSYGQGEVLTTPLDVAMMYSALANDGNIMQPILDITDKVDSKVYKEAISTDNLPILIDCFKSVVNDTDGTGNKAKVEGLDIAGKTGTAELKTSKDDTDGKENGWFVGVDVDESKLAISMIIEDVKGRGGSDLATTKVKNIINSYLNK